jgi:beta-glucanase (GH16 family)
MKRHAFVLASTVALCACNPNLTAVDAGYHPTQRNWVPTWNDEFTSGNTPVAPGTGKWVTAKFCGGFNAEKQCYTDLLQNVSMRNGHLIIRAMPDNCWGTDAHTAAGNNEVGTVTCGSGTPTHFYSSGRLHTLVTPSSDTHSWKYGRIEIRAKLPYGDGTWPAFWMMPADNNYGKWPQSGEIDIMEAVNLESPTEAGDKVESNVHLCSKPGYYTPNAPGGNPNPHPCANVRTLTGDNSYDQVHFPRKLYMAPDGNCWPDLSKRFHTYSMEWSDNDLRFFLDDKLIGTHILHANVDNVAPFQHPFYLIINLAVGGKMVPNNGHVDTNDWMPTTPRSAELVIDWVRVYWCGTDPNTARGCIYQGTGLGRKPTSAVLAVDPCPQTGRTD